MCENTATTETVETFICPKCKAQHPIKEVPVKDSFTRCGRDHEYERMGFYTCPTCGGVFGADEL